MGGQTERQPERDRRDLGIFQDASADCAIQTDREERLTRSLAGRFDDRLMFTRRLPEILAIVFVFIATPIHAQDLTSARRGRGRIVVLMVWDGLRPDFVTQRDTPNLFRMAREGVRFDRHHSIFPTLTMVNATALATGAPPGVNGLEGNNFYLAPSAELP